MLEGIYHALTHRVWQLSNLVHSNLQGTYTGRILAGFWDLFAQLWYFAVLGALISALVWRYLPMPWIRRTLQRRAKASIFAASLLGLVSPLCTFAAIPMVGSLIALRVPAPPLVAFMLASPLMNPSLFFYTAGIISTEMAVARVFTALSVGILAGFATRHALGRDLLSFEELALDHAPRKLYPAVAGGSDQPLSADLAVIAHRFREDLLFIGKYFTLGIAIAAVAKAFLSEELVLSVVGPGSGWAVPIAVALGVPLYACGGGSIPIVETMMQMGMTSGAALAFFIAGPATKFSTLTMLGAVFGRRLLGCYLGIMMLSALFWGYTYPFASEQLTMQGGVEAVYGELMAR